MAVTDQPLYFSYDALGGTVFAYGCRVLAASDLVVTLDSVVQVLGVDYTVNGIAAPSGGNVTFLAPATGLVEISRKTLAQRLTDYQFAGDFLSPVVNRDFDRLWMAVQEIIKGVSAASNLLRVSPGEVLPPLPPAAERASLALLFDADGLPFVGTPIGAPSSAFGASLVFQDTAAQARSLLSAVGVADLANTASDTLGDALIGVNRAETGSVARSLHFWIKASRRNLCDFLTTAKTDDVLSGAGSLDCTTEFIAAIAAASAAGGTRGAFLELPQGLIGVTAAIATGTANRVWVEGQGNATQIRTNNATADIFTLGDGSAECSGFVFSDFDIWSSVTKSAGYGFNARLCTDSQWRNVSIGSNDLYTVAGGVNRMFRGWYFDRFDTVSIYGGQCVTSSDGVQARGNIGDTYGAELVIDGNLRFLRQSAAGAAAVRIGGCCGGVYLRRADASLSTYGVVIDTTLVSGGTTATKRNREIFVEGFNVDSCKKWGFFQAADSVALLVMDKPWAASCGTDDDGSGGIWIGGGATVVPQVVLGGAPFVYNNVGPGVHAENGCYLSIDGGQITQNGTSASGGHGIEFGATLPARFSCTGSDIALNGKVAKGYGINLPVGMDGFTIVGCSIYGNLQGPINNAAGFGINQIIRDCTGYCTENSGVATVANGTSSVVVNHGLAGTPGSVQLTPLGAPSVGTYSAGAYGTTTFVIDNGASASGARQFAWRASMTGG